MDVFVNGGTLAVHMPVMYGALQARFPEGFKLAETPHMTVLDIADSKILRANMGLSSRGYETSFLEGLVGAKLSVFQSKPESLGIGYSENEEAASYHEVYSWPEVQEWRTWLSLGPKDLHVTLATRGKNAHLLPKGPSTTRESWKTG